MPAGPAGCVQGGEFVVVRIDGAGEEVLLDQLAVRLNKLVETAEKDTLLAPLGLDDGRG
jgi:hypothetical protein